MEVKELVKGTRHSVWAQQLQDQQDSGLSICEWCNQNGISENTFHYRMKIVRQEACNSLEKIANNITRQAEPVFAKVNIEPKIENAVSGIEIHTNGINVHIAPDSNTEHVRMVLEAITYA